MQTTTHASVPLTSASAHTEPRRPRASERQPATAPDPQRRAQQVRRVLVIVLLLNLAVAGAKIIFGLGSGSLAMTADGFHSLLDGLSNVIAIVGLMAAARPPDPNHPYGHHRFETLTSLAIAAMMLIAVFGLLQGAWSRLSSGTVPDVSAVSFVIMLVTMAINLGVTTWERRAARQLNSSVLSADAQHTASDLFVSLSVLVSLAAVTLGVGRADAAMTVLIALLILRGAWHIVRDAVLVLSDAHAGDPDEIAHVVRAVPGVIGTHNVRTRGGDGVAWVDLHVQVDPGMRVDDAHDIASRVAQEVEAALEVPSDVTVHIEPADPEHLSQDRGHDPLGHATASRTK